MQYTTSTGEPLEEGGAATSQKMQLILANTQVQNDDNAALLNEWYKHTSNKKSTEILQVATTHLRHRLTYTVTGNTPDMLQKHATYYQDMLDVPAKALQRLETLGKRWQPGQLSSWIEFNTLGANAGWRFPVNLPGEELLGTFEETNTNRRIFYRWTKYHDEFVCIHYSESFAAPCLQQIDLLFDAHLTLATQYHKAMALADLLKVHAFPSVLLETMQRYEAQQLGISLWLSPHGVLKFGLRLYQPSAKLMMSLHLLCGLTKEQEEPLALIHATMKEVAWVEIQQTADGLVSEMGLA